MAAGRHALPLCGHHRIDRKLSRRAARQPADRERAGGRLRRGALPRGHEHPGLRGSPLPPSLLDHAARTGMPVHAAALTYRTPPGEPPAHLSVCWWGDAPLFAHAQRLFELRRFDVVVRFSPAAVSGSDRKELAASCTRRCSASSSRWSRRRTVRSKPDSESRPRRRRAGDLAPGTGRGDAVARHHGRRTRVRRRCERSSRFNDRHFQSSINGLKRLLESVHSGGVVNIEDTVNLWHVPTKPPPEFGLGDSLLSHRVIQLNLWHGQCWNTDRYLSR